MLVGFVENGKLYLEEKNKYIYYLTGYPVSSKIIGRIYGCRISKIGIRYNPSFMSLIGCTKEEPRGLSDRSEDKKY